VNFPLCLTSPGRHPVLFRDSEAQGVFFSPFFSSAVQLRRITTGPLLSCGAPEVFPPTQRPFHLSSSYLRTLFVFPLTGISSLFVCGLTWQSAPFSFHGLDIDSNARTFFFRRQAALAPPSTCGCSFRHRKSSGYGPPFLARQAFLGRPPPVLLKYNVRVSCLPGRHILSFFVFQQRGVPSGRS